MLGPSQHFDLPLGKLRLGVAGACPVTVKEQVLEPRSCLYTTLLF